MIIKPTKRPTESLSSPRARTYEKPWLSNSTNLHSSMPKKKTSSTSRPHSSTHPSSNRPLSKTVDLTVTSKEQEGRNAAKANLKKISKNDDVIKEIEKTTMKVVNAAKVTGKPIKCDLHNEELKLDYKIEKEKPKKEIDTKAQMELQRQKKGMKTTKSVKHIPELTPKPKKQISGKMRFILRVVHRRVQIQIFEVRSSVT